MVLKRKRSDSEISTSSSLLSSPLSASNYMSVDSQQASISSASLFSARTRKRYRDNRPSESAVHRTTSKYPPSSQSLTPFLEHTLSILFAAQQNPQSTPPAHIAQAPISSIPNHQSSQQSSLHSFWVLPSSSTRQSSPLSTASSTSPPKSYFQPTNCEDCNSSLGSAHNGDSMNVDMMMDISTEGGNYGCSSCGKQVCHSCAISNLGVERKCLMCAKPSKPVAGLAGSRLNSYRGGGMLISDFGRRNLF